MAGEERDYQADVKGPLEEDRKGRGRIVGKISGRDALTAHSNSGRAWKGKLADRVRVARGMPQAVLKITSFGRGLGEAKKLTRYIGEQGETKVETDDGSILDTVEELEKLAEDWSADFSDRKDPNRKARDVMHIVVSVPAGSDHDQTLEAAREFFAEEFGKNHEYAFAAHDETDHFHVHLLVKVRGRDGKQMRSTRKDPDLWRQKFAAKAREKGVNVDASPRWARGKGRRSSPPTAIYELRRRNETLPKEKRVEVRRDQEAAQEALRRARDPNDRPNEHEEAIRAINRFERLEFAKQAYGVIEASKKVTDDRQRVKALEMASDLAVHAEKMPRPKSRIETMIQAVKPADGGPEQPHDEVRKLTKATERGIRDQVKTFSDRSLQRRAVAARARLSGILKVPDRSKSSAQERDIER